MTVEYLLNPEVERANKRKSAIITALIVIGILVLSIFWVLKQPEEQFPPPGILIAMGTTEQGSGDTKPVPQKETPKEEVKPQPEPEPQPQVTETPVETVDDPNSTSIDEKKEEKKEEVKEPEKPVEEVKEPLKPKYTMPAEEPSNEEPKDTKGKYEMPGDMGNPKGSEQSQNMGTIPGLGNFEFGGGLSGRGVQRVPDVEKKVRREQGKIILEIWVDASGNVVKVGDLMRGTEITDPAMIREARQLASKVRFDPASGSNLVRGTITITFKY